MLQVEAHQPIRSLKLERVLKVRTPAPAMEGPGNAIGQAKGQGPSQKGDFPRFNELVGFRCYAAMICFTSFHLKLGNFLMNMAVEFTPSLVLGKPSIQWSIVHFHEDIGRGVASAFHPDRGAPSRSRSHAVRGPATCSGELILFESIQHVLAPTI